MMHKSAEVMERHARAGVRGAGVRIGLSLAARDTTGLFDGASLVVHAA
jgi:hypothetical protein